MGGAESGRPWDVVLFGATGFTGQLVAEALGRQGRGRVRWAIAGRDEARLRGVKSTLVGMHPDLGEVGLIVADSRDEASLRRMAAGAKVLVTTVGPYVRHGVATLAACVAERTHYLDLTGEPEFVRASRATHGEAAREARIRVVHCCGFDSVPADLGALFTVRRLPASEKKQVRCYVRARGTISGGTWASFLEIAGRPRKGPRTGRSISGAGPGRGPWLHRSPDGGQAVPWPVVDQDIVRESARCLPDVYGPEFEFQEFFVSRTRARALRFVAGLGAARLAASSSLLRSWLESRLPSGSGPDQAKRDRSTFDLTFVGKSDGVRVVTRVSGGDPGYTETSRMLAAAALLLATREADLPRTAGVITPVVAFGDALLEELVRLGIRFEVLP